MPDLILHHYAGSPFSEKVRLILGFKGMSYQSVNVPVMLPKPDVMALTGGYRRTPFMQLGADIYCDSALMCKVIDRIQPQPSLYPAETAGIASIVAQWADTQLFWIAVPYSLQPAGVGHLFPNAPAEFMKTFAADRAAMNPTFRRPTFPDGEAHLHNYFAWLEAMLADGRHFLFGAPACIADFAAAQSVWFMRRAGPVAAVLAPYPLVNAWYDRVDAFGQGESHKMTSADAIALAAATTTYAPTNITAGQGFAEGDEVTVMPVDYAADLVPGRLKALNTEEIVIARTDERAGLVHVHFPRVSFQVKKAVSP